MKRCKTSAILACALISIAALFPARAGATCMEACKTIFVDKDCNQALDGRWPAGRKLSFVAACGGCCRAGPGSGGCTYDPVENTDAMKITPVDENGHDTGEPVEGTFGKTGKKCHDWPIIEFDGELKAGGYVLTAGWEGIHVIVVEESEAIGDNAVKWVPMTRKEEGDGGGGPGDYDPYGPKKKGPPPVEEKKGGCASCAVGVPTEDNAGAPLLFAVLLHLLAFRRARGLRLHR